MAKDDTTRKIYTLPTELVERIIAFQRVSKIGSEVEAVRQLLDFALGSKETEEMLVQQVLNKLAQGQTLFEVTKSVLMEHPNLVDVELNKFQVSFTLEGQKRFTITRIGEVFKGPAGSDISPELMEWATKSMDLNIPPKLAELQNEFTPQDGDFSLPADMEFAPLDLDAVSELQEHDERLESALKKLQSKD